MSPLRGGPAGAALRATLAWAKMMFLSPPLHPRSLVVHPAGLSCHSTLACRPQRSQVWRRELRNLECDLPTDPRAEPPLCAPLRVPAPIYVPRPAPRPRPDFTFRAPHRVPAPISRSAALRHPRSFFPALLSHLIPRSLRRRHHPSPSYGNSYEFFCGNRPDND